MEIATNKLKSNIKPPLNKSTKNGNGQSAITHLSLEVLQALVENSPINVMLANRDGVITYLNRKSIETLLSIESDLPISVSEIVGSSYDVFHKNPAHQRKLLANERNLPHQAIIAVGKELLDLLVTAVHDANGEYIGPMVTWSVVTEKLKLEDEMARIQSMMENAPINVMCADPSGTINYINPKSLETLKGLEKYLPIRLDQMKGSSIDVFHKNPSHQRGIIGNERNLPHRAIIQVGPEKLDLLVSPIRDKNGKYIGPMVTWEVVTEKLKIETDMARIFSMMEQAPVNVMMCDLDFNLTYINPKSRETLKSLERILPITVDKMLGSSIDVFHKNPEKQRRLLSDSKNLPHRAKIKLGEHTLDLLVSPIFDKNKRYLGPMVTWEVITNKLQLVDSLTQTSQQLAAAAEELSAISSQMAKNASQTSERSNTAAANSEEVSKGVQTVATNTEEMVSSIKEIARSSSEAAGISKDGMQKATETNATINQLSEASKEIGNVIKVISSIAQQTNLLALNATIEAARAGDAGKGFAVVANEVKELAKQTGKATEEITNKIAAIQESSKGAVGAIASISKVIEQINTISMTIAAAVEEQTATTNEVSRVVQESNKAVEGIAETVRSVAQGAQESASGAAQSLEAAKSLSNLATSLRDLVKKIEV